MGWCGATAPRCSARTAGGKPTTVSPGRGAPRRTSTSRGSTSCGFAGRTGSPACGRCSTPSTRPSPAEAARSAETEIGANIDFLGRFSLEYSYSRKETKDQILLVPLSAATGYLNQWQNAATLVGKTHELSLGVLLADRPEFSWRLNVAADR